METTVVNIRSSNYEYDVFIGRPSPFGNPFHVGIHGSRSEVIDMFERWFRKKLEDPEYKKRVLSLRGKRLGCFCHPLPCHGDVIVKILGELTCE